METWKMGCTLQMVSVMISFIFSISFDDSFSLHVYSWTDVSIDC